MDLHMYYTVNMAVGNYFGIKKIDGQMKIESVDLHGKDLTESQDHFTVTDVLLSKTPVILTVKDLQVESYEDEKVMIEYTLANSMPFKDFVDCVVNNEKVHLTREYLAYPIPKLKIGLNNKTNG